MHTTTKANWTRPILRWAGSKRKLLPKLIACTPVKFERYIEPFLGSACYFLALKPQSAILGDFNTELIKMYRVLREKPNEIAEAVHEMPGDPEYYYKLRAQSAFDLDRVSRAARFIYLNRFCFNGVYRANRSNHFNVPRGSHTGKIPSKEEFKECAKLLRKAKLRATDFEDCLSDTKTGDFIYLDPPYASVARLDHGEYGYNSFSEKDIDRLLSSVKRADRNGAIILLSYAYTPIFQKSLPNWHFKKIDVRRYVAGFADQRLEVKELLVSNKPLPRFLNDIK